MKLEHVSVDYVDRPNSFDLPEATIRLVIADARLFSIPELVAELKATFAEFADSGIRVAIKDQEGDA